MKIILSLLLFLFIVPGAARANTRYAGGEALDFLLLDGNSRAMAMGGAYTALAYDANALQYNPAGLALVRDYQATVMHNSYIQGLTHDYFAVATKQGLGLSVNHLKFGDIPRTTIATPDGNGTRYEISDLSISGGYGRTLFGSLSVGAGVKYIRESIDTVQAKGYALDAGALYAVPQVPGLTAGGSILNIGPDILYQKQTQKLPINFRGGAAYVFPLLGNENTVSADVMKTRTDKLRYAAGAETVFAKMVAFRMGINTTNDAALGVTGGVGWIGKYLAVDYAIAPFGDLGISHSASLSYKWGGEEKEKKDKTPAVIAEKKEPEPPSPAQTGPVDHFALAQQFIQEQSYDKAKEALAQAYAPLGPDDRRQVLYYERLGHVALRENDLGKAQTLYMEALTLAAGLGLSDPSVADANAGMGVCLMRKKKTGYALKFFHKALEAGPSAQTRRYVEKQMAVLKENTPEKQ